MRKFYFIIVFIILSTIFTTFNYKTDLATLANTEINNNYITKENVIELELIGEGSAFAKPDSATIIARIEYSDTIKDTSMQSAIQIFNSIKDILYKNNFNESDINKNCFYTYKTTSNTANNNYISYIDFSINIDNLNHLHDTVVLISNQQYLEITNINYKLKNYKPVYLEALNIAINNAKEKANNLIKSDNITIRKITEQNNYYPVTIYREYIIDNIESEINTPLEITTNVIVEFEYNK